MVQPAWFSLELFIPGLNIILGDGERRRRSWIRRCGYGLWFRRLPHVDGEARRRSNSGILSSTSCSAGISQGRRVTNLSRFQKEERFDQDKGGFGDSNGMGSRGVQFPFAVADRVIIKGNKRTPQRFVGREAIVTTQCLNGWYVVKTLDNAESVKLQYRSLAKVSEDPSSKLMSGKMAPNWL